MIDKLEVGMMNGSVHNFKKGEFGVEKIEINESRGFIEISYASHEGEIKHVLIPLQNVEKCEYVNKS